MAANMKLQYFMRFVCFPHLFVYLHEMFPHFCQLQNKIKCTLFHFYFIEQSFICHYFISFCKIVLVPGCIAPIKACKLNDNEHLNRWMIWTLNTIQCSECNRKKNIHHKNGIEQTSGAKIDDKKNLELIDLLLSLIPISNTFRFSFLFRFQKWIYEKLSGI